MFNITAEMMDRIIANKREQREHIGPLAWELVRSGNFLGWHDIEAYLRYEEHCFEARHVLDNERIRQELDKLCKEARKTMKISDLTELLN